MRLILVLTILLNICSCAGIKRPDADICGINFAADRSPHLRCYNILKDFNDDGTMKSGAKAHNKNIYAPNQLNAGKYVSKEDWPKIQVWIQDMRDYVAEKCQ